MGLLTFDILALLFIVIFLIKKYHFSMQQKILFCLVFLLSSLFLKAQVLTKEDSLNAGLIAKDATTVLSGYGEIKYINLFQDKTLF